MGLHLNFELRLDGSHSEQHAMGLLSRLHEAAAQLPFELLHPLVSRHDAAAPHMLGHWHSIAAWAAIVATPHEDDDQPDLHGDAETAIGFTVYPGRGSETATFGLMRRHDATGAPVDWHWMSMCKTQYASIVSDAHLVQCHTSLVRLLDAAIAMGFEVEVRDETHYWDRRDEYSLIEEVHAMNRVVAAFAGKLHDRMGASGHLHSPIFEHRDFERLEMDADE
jgi:hypothetical protein